MNIKSNIKAVLFDLDGTLLDSKKSVLEAVYYTANKYAHGKFTFQDIEDRFGEPFDEFMNELDIGTKEEIINTYMKHITEHHDQSVLIFENVQESLDTLKMNGLKLGIVTNKQRELTIRGLDLFNLTDLFDVIVTLDDVTEGKPSAEPILKAIELLGVNKEEALMIGDTIFDVKAARAAKVKVAILDWYNMYAHDDPDFIFLNITAKLKHFGWGKPKECIGNG
jgi:pyrophosphatase PpaX